MRLSSSCALNLALAALLTGVALAGNVFGPRTVALSGSPAADVGGAVFANFQAPVIATGGRVAFGATLALGGGVTTANDQGIWAYSDATLGQLQVREGDAVPGAPAGQTFKTFYRAHFGRGGTFAVHADTNAFLDGVWTHRFGALGALALEGAAAPGLPGVQWNISSATRTQMRDDGVVYFDPVLSGAGVNDTNNLSIFAAAPGGGATLIARRGERAIGLAEEFTFNIFDLRDRTQPRAAFKASIRGPGVDTTNDEGIWAHGPLGLRLVVREGAQADGMPLGAQFQVLATHAFTPSTTNAARTAFIARAVGGGLTEANDTGIWAESGFGLELVAREGNAAPGGPAGATFGDFQGAENRLPRWVGFGRLAFVHTMVGGGVTAFNDEGIWVGDKGGVSLVAREGDPAPGAAPGQVFIRNDAFQFLPVLNEAGQVAFWTRLTGQGITSANDFGIWATDPDGALRLIAREGDPLEVAPGDVRIVSSLALAADPSSGLVLGTSFSGAGDLTFRATFTDGSLGVFVTRVPEAASAALLAFAGLTLRCTRRSATVGGQRGGPKRG
ncbi:MAG: choice-of-anchor tandem repeat NxxGxxAF-containing protein [Phycisphaerae bacterium]